LKFFSNQTILPHPTITKLPSARGLAIGVDHRRFEIFVKE